MLLRSSLRAGFSAILVCLASACNADQPAQSPKADEPGPGPTAARELGLMGTIPIYWGEAGGFDEVLGGGGTDHWARAQLETEFRLDPLDSLTEESLERISLLMLAQPRALSPAENVALDEWVRDGGRLLLFADPMLTGDSRFAIGDRRRPQDVILLSPILMHWGLALQFDDGATSDYVTVQAPGAVIPVRLAGVFALRQGEADCSLLASGVLAVCEIGRGRAVILADAALLDLNDPHPGAPAALDWLVETSFAED